MASMVVKIRAAEHHDTERILSLIRELALFEKAGDEVELTVNQLQKDMFDEPALCKALVAEMPGVGVIGAALYYNRYSTWKGKTLYLEDLIVTEDHRGKGIGKQLLEGVIGVAAEMGAARLEWQVLDWNADAIRFYERMGASLDATWINVRLTGEQLGTYKLNHRL
jgi:GNAT superfamily N-acetyltransferase